MEPNIINKVQIKFQKYLKLSFVLTSQIVTNAKPKACKRLNNSGLKKVINIINKTILNIVIVFSLNIFISFL